MGVESVGLFCGAFIEGFALSQNLLLLCCCRTRMHVFAFVVASVVHGPHSWIRRSMWFPRQNLVSPEGKTTLHAIVLCCTRQKIMVL